MEKVRILIVEDEQRLANVLKKQFEENGFEVNVAYDGYHGKLLLENAHFDLMILDVNLPLINGFELCKEIRRVNNGIPIIMLTAMGTTDNKLTGFGAGADDYVLKPFDFNELLARVNVFLRRSKGSVETDKLRMADLEMDLLSKSVIRSGVKIELTAKEFSLLATLLRKPNKVLSREYIIQEVWDIDFDTGTNVIDVYINYLRKKIDKEFEPKLIHTKYGFGFYCSIEEH